MLVAGKVDLINTTGLTARDALVVAKTRVLFDRREVFGGPTQGGTFAARAGFLAKNRAAMVDYMEDYLRGLRWFADPAHHDDAVKRLAAFTKAPASQFDWFFTNGDEYRDPNGLPNLSALQNSIDVLADFGLIKPGLNISKYADLSIVKEAAARLQ
jgi:sulfonate transport system substrate-binding protein